MYKNKTITSTKHLASRLTDIIEDNNNNNGNANGWNICSSFRTRYVAFGSFVSPALFVYYLFVSICFSSHPLFIHFCKYLLYILFSKSKIKLTLAFVKYVLVACSKWITCQREWWLRNILILSKKHL